MVYNTSDRKVMCNINYTRSGLMCRKEISFFSVITKTVFLIPFISIFKFNFFFKYESKRGEL